MKSLQRLISSFYDLSRFEAGEYKFELKSINLSNIISDTLALLYVDFIYKEIESKIDIEENIPTTIVDMQ